MIARRKTEQPGHADIVRIVVFDEFLTAHGMHDWRLELHGQLDQLIMGARATCAGQDCHSRRTIEFGRQLIQLFLTGNNVRLRKCEVDTAIVIFRIQ